MKKMPANYSRTIREMHALPRLKNSDPRIDRCIDHIEKKLRELDLDDIEDLLAISTNDGLYLELVFQPAPPLGDFARHWYCWFDGQFRSHAIDHPSIIVMGSKGLDEILWTHHGTLHRLDGPAYEFLTKTGMEQRWHLNGVEIDPLPGIADALQKGPNAVAEAILDAMTDRDDAQRTAIANAYGPYVPEQILENLLTVG